MSRVRAPDPHNALIAALAKQLSPAEVQVHDSHETGWASATFTGARHSFSLTLSGAGAAEALAKLEREIGEAEFDLTGHVVADILVTARRTDWHVSPPVIRIELEALTVETDYRPTPSALRREAMSPAGMGLFAKFRDWRRTRAVSSLPINPAIELASLATTTRGAGSDGAAERGIA